LPDEEPGVELQPFTLEYSEELAALYNRENEGVTGSAVRPTYRQGKAPGTDRGWYWIDADGCIAGFVTDVRPFKGIYEMEARHAAELDRGEVPKVVRERFVKGWEPHYKRPLSAQAFCVAVEQGDQWLMIDGPGRWDLKRQDDTIHVFVGGGSNTRSIHVDEAVGDPEQILRVIGHFVRQSALCERICFDRLPPRSRLGRYLRRLPSCHLDNNDRQENSYMIQILNLGSLFEKLVPELAARLSHSALAAWQGELLISTGEEEILLKINAAQVEVAAAEDTPHAVRGGQEIAQLVVGTDVPSEVVRMHDIELSGDAALLIEVLFPAQDPQMRNQGL